MVAFDKGECEDKKRGRRVARDKTDKKGEG